MLVANKCKYYILADTTAWGFEMITRLACAAVMAVVVLSPAFGGSAYVIGYCVVDPRDPHYSEVHAARNAIRLLHAFDRTGTEREQALNQIGDACDQDHQMIAVERVSYIGKYTADGETLPVCKFTLNNARGPFEAVTAGPWCDTENN